MTYDEAFLKLIEYFTTQENWDMVENLFYFLGEKLVEESRQLV
jgi:hypothetical protein